MTGSEAAITAGVATGIVIGFQAAKVALGKLNGRRKNGTSGHGERIAVLETNYRHIVSTLDEIKTAIGDLKEDRT